MNNAKQGSREVEAVAGFNNALATFRENIKDTTTDITTLREMFENVKTAFANLMKVKPKLITHEKYKTVAKIFHLLNSLKNNNEQNNEEKRTQIEIQLDELEKVHIINTPSHGGRRRSTRRRSTRRRSTRRRSQRRR